MRASVKSNSKTFILFFFLAFQPIATWSSDSNSDIARAFELLTAITWGSCQAIQTVVEVDPTKGTESSLEQIHSVTGVLTGFEEPPNDTKIYKGRNEVRKFRSPQVRGGSLEKLWTSARPLGCGSNKRPGYSWNDQRLSGNFESSQIQAEKETKLLVEGLPNSTTDCSAAVISALARAGLSPLPFDHPTMKKFNGFRDDNDADTKWMSREWVGSPCFQIIDYRNGAQCEEGDILLAVDKDLSSGHTAVITTCGEFPFGRDTDSCELPIDFSHWTMKIGQVTLSLPRKFATPPAIFSAQAEYTKSGNGRIGQLLQMIREAKCAQRKKPKIDLPPLEAGAEKFTILRHTRDPHCRYKDPMSGNILDQKHTVFVGEKGKMLGGPACYDKCSLK